MVHNLDSFDAQAKRVLQRRFLASPGRRIIIKLRRGYQRILKLRNQEREL